MSPFRAPGNRHPYDQHFWRCEWYNAAGFTLNASGGIPLLSFPHQDQGNRTITPVGWADFWEGAPGSIDGRYWGMVQVNTDGLYRLQVEVDYTNAVAGGVLMLDSSVWTGGPPHYDGDDRPQFPSTTLYRPTYASEPGGGGNVSEFWSDTYPLLSGDAVDFGNIFNDSTQNLTLLGVDCVLMKVA